MSTEHTNCCNNNISLTIFTPAILTLNELAKFLMASDALLAIGGGGFVRSLGFLLFFFVLFFHFFFNFSSIASV